MWPYFFIAIAVGMFILAWALARIAAPANEYERRRDDEAQAEYIRNYMAERLARSNPD